ncbi:MULTISPECIES: class I SAM-dependent DNA methyltransferase [unclassified Pseudomonas]|uniref:class I SAM-dependent DNA methyltransferase n=2 Tax=Pseudomonas TaxID=286 RepID=UPI000D036FAB|nr:MULTISPECIES: DNA methyltransferase [unclassified Pseudomonas]MBD9550524.1 class I SAM-dependent DNA methyltransferase [Pseudomonas sp. PDM01]MEB0204021.1 class I SAM-dependent DNA methyltransferase [Pseudomonas sp. CCC3.1]PRW98019.1 lactate dehydrogenase [Pseudomonas fragi]WPX35415.1 class I SAM-dependent DNA methyltransferase [Pseudomonas sp. CCC3.1]
MNAVEIESAISDLALEPFDAVEFPFVFLAAFGNKETALKRLRAGNNNASDVPGGVLLRSNIHIAACESGSVGETLKALRASPATTKAKAKFILATDGQTLEAEELITGETITCDYPDLPNHFGFLLPLAGISTIKEIKDNPIDVRATSRLNKLYIELLNEDPDWAKDERRADMNHFMARLVFCFFAEDTDIFNGDGLFTKTVEQYSERDGSNTHQVLSEIFRAMNIKLAERATVQPRLPNWANGFPYVNGGLFSGSTEVPRFTRMARTYLLHAGNLNWKKINPDIFGSMIQAVADDEERGALGMHYTSVPNILKVLNPLLLDDLRAQLDAAGDNKAKLHNLRKRMARIRVFDPACGSGNFLVIAYKQMREIEAEINRRRGEPHLGSDIPLTNFRGIELRDFPAEIARLALIIAEYQCDVLYRGQKDALEEFLPLDSQNWIVCGNALRLDWLNICPPTGTGVKLHANDLFATPLDQAQIDFENEGGETYICGNPPYKGNAKKTAEQKKDMGDLLDKKVDGWGLLDYVCGWFFKAHEYAKQTRAKFAFVATNSVSQGQHVTGFWKPLFDDGLKFNFAVRSFKWSNLATNDAGVTVVCIGAGVQAASADLYDDDKKLSTKNINAYLMPADDYWVMPSSRPISVIPPMLKGNYYGMSEHLIFDTEGKNKYLNAGLDAAFIRKFYGASEVTKARPRACFWFPDDPAAEILEIADIKKKLEQGKAARQTSKDAVSNGMVKRPHQFREMRSCENYFFAIPVVSSENRSYLPVDLLDNQSIISNKCFALYDAPLWNMALIASRLHWAWIGAVCVRMRTDFSYSNTLGWNTFPVPLLTEQNKADLTACAEAILLAREAHFPAAIADLYDPDNMPDNLRRAHECNDEVLERIYIGRRFKNDTERLEKLFDLYTKMAANAAKAAPKKPRGRKA